MYAVAVSRSFVAQHYLTVPDPGPEGELHSHHYTIEATFYGPELDEFGYLVDIDDVNAAMDDLVDRYRDRTLNDVPAFEGVNPSVEHFARISGDRLLASLEPETATALRIAVAEDDVARVSHERQLD